MAEKMIVSLVSVFKNPKGKRARRAIKKIRVQIAKRFHLNPESVFISQKINNAVFAKGFEKIPRRISLLIDQDKGLVKAYLAGEKIPKKKEEKKKETKEEKKEEKEIEEEVERKKREKRAKEIAAEKTAIKRKTDRV